MGRHTSLILPVASLLLFLLSAVIGLRSIFVRDEIYFSVGGHFCILATFPRHLHLIVDREPSAAGHPAEFHRGLLQYPPRARYFEVRVKVGAGAVQVSVPYWLLLLLSAPLPLWTASQILRRRRAIVRGLCPVCNYDLRASTDRCPECGTPIVRPALPR